MPCQLDNTERDGGRERKKKEGGGSEGRHEEKMEVMMTRQAELLLDF